MHPFTLLLAVCLCQPALTPADAELCRYAPEPGYMVKERYITRWDGSRRVPAWTLEKLTRDTLINSVGREGRSFYPDPEIPAEFNAALRDYTGSMHDRGHLAAAANHTYDDADMESTFTLANVMPMHPNVNRGVWRKLEEQTREEAQEEGVRCLYLLTAPAWIADDPQFVNGAYMSHIRVKTIGKHRVWVPTHLARATLAELEDGTYRMKAWIVPNKEVVDPDTEKHRATVNAFERAVGIDAFSVLPDDVENVLESNK